MYFKNSKIVMYIYINFYKKRGFYECLFYIFEVGKFWEVVIVL